MTRHYTDQPPEYIETAEEKFCECCGAYTETWQSVDDVVMCVDCIFSEIKSIEMQVDEHGGLDNALQSRLNQLT